MSNTPAQPGAMQTPSVGRIVRYVICDDDVGINHQYLVGQVCPAIITRCSSCEGDLRVNLQIFVDGPKHYFAGYMPWKRDVLYSEKADRGTWHWPGRV